MRKTYFLVSFAIIVFLLSFNTSFAGSHSEPGFAKDSAEKVNYELPYPGLLPDSPLYFLRIIRDKAISFLIADPLKKAEFDLLQADKRLNAGIYLFNKGKVSMSLSTISKAENYFEEALTKRREAAKQGMDTEDIERRLMQAVAKHREELGKIIKRVNKNFKGNFEKEYKRVIDFEKGLKH